MEERWPRRRPPRVDRTPPHPGCNSASPFPSSVSTTAQTGHIILIVSKDTSAEPRFQYQVYSPDVQPGFGLDVNDLAPGKPAVIDGTVLGWPLKSVNDLPAGDYQVQAILNRYETYHCADGHTLELPPEKGEGQHWYSKPGNFYSTPQRVHSRSGRRPDRRSQPGQGDPADPRTEGHQVGEVRADQERPALEVLGAADVPRCVRAAAGRLR